MKGLIFVLLAYMLCPAEVMADSGGMMGGPGMMVGGGGQMGMGGALFMGIFGLVYLVVIALFFWLLFRIVRAVERIAEAKEKEKSEHS